MPVMSRRDGPRRVVRRALAACSAVALLLILTGWSSPAHAHTELVASSPAQDDVVGIDTEHLVLVFSDTVATGSSQVVVLDEAESDAVVGAPVVTGSTVEVPLDLRSRGRHDVTYRVVSTDGHALVGDFEFTVGSGGSGDITTAAQTGSRAPGAAVRAPPTTVGPQVPGVVWVGGIGLVVLCLVAVQALRRPHPSGPVDGSSR